VQDASFTLGPIGLQGFEIPQSVRFGGRYRLALHPLADGRRIVERLGPDDNDIQFQGIFSGPSAESRVRAVDNLRLSGDAVWLTWESFRRQVIVKQFTVIYQSRWWITYQISCTVVNQRRIVSSQLLLAAAMVSSNLTSALSASIGTAISLAPLQVALSSQNALTAGARDNDIAVATAAAALDEVNSQISYQSAMLTEPFTRSNDYATTGAVYASRVSSAGTLAAAITLRSYVGRIQVNLSGLTT
jgi:hypothetical protein